MASVGGIDGAPQIVRKEVLHERPGRESGQGIALRLVALCVGRLSLKGVEVSGCWASASVRSRFTDANV